MTALGSERQERLARLREENRQLGNKMTGHRRNAATLLQLVASLETSGGAEHGELGSASKSSIRRFVITEKAPTRAFSWLKAATTAFTFNTLLRHYAKQANVPIIGLLSVGSMPI